MTTVENGERPPAPQTRLPAMAALRAQVEALATINAGELTPAAAMSLFTDLYTAADQLHALAALALPAVDADGLWATTGARTLSTWLTRHLHLTSAKAHRLARLARALRDDLPRTSDALRADAAGPAPEAEEESASTTAGAMAGAGSPATRVGVEQAEILTSHAPTSPIRRLALADPQNSCGEQFLLDQARDLPADTLRTLVRRWSAAADPDADERGYSEATEREYLEIAATTGGYHLSGFLSTEHGQALLTALEAAAVPASPDNLRSRSQRRADALTTLVRAALDGGRLRTRGKVRPHFNILIDYPTLLTLTEPAAVAPPGPTPAAVLRPAVFEDGVPVPRAVLDRLMCDADVTRVIFGPDSQLLDLGRTQRLYPARLHRAIIARDKQCQYPGCTAPPRYCESHHTIHWHRDHGGTDARTGVLLCGHHHVHVHNNNITIRWNPKSQGWTFTDRHGKAFT